MSGYINYCGQVFGRLTVVGPLTASKYGRFGSIWICGCSCGKEVRVDINNLKKGRTQSCGCLHKEAVTKHGLSKTPEYKAWHSLLSRCYNRKDSGYPQYGKRGITVCAEWRTNFFAFLEDMGERPSPEHSIDRRDNNGNYSKNNCRWATIFEQNRNKSNNRYYEMDGRSMVVEDWCTEVGLHRATVEGRLKAGWTFEDAIKTPAHPKHEHQYTYRGETKSLSEWCSSLGVNYCTAWYRITKNGWSFEKAVLAA